MVKVRAPANEVSSSTAFRVLVVDDKEQMFRALERYARAANIASNWSWVYLRAAADGLRAVQTSHFDLIATDLRFPCGEMNGADLIRAIRQVPLALPVIVHTGAELDESERVALFEAGADDVVVIPFSTPMEFLMRCHALMRRCSGTYAIKASTFHDLCIDFAKRAAHCGSAVVSLTSDQCQLLNVLTSSEHAVSYADLARALGYVHAHDRNAIHEAVRRLRLRLNALGTRVTIEPVAGFGYRIGSSVALGRIP